MPASRDGLWTTPGDDPAANYGTSQRHASRPVNPYRPGRPVEGSTFFGRANEVGTILSLLRSLHSISVVGPRRIGKTSLLRQIALPSTLASEGLSATDLVTVFISFAEFAELGRDGILRMMLDRARAALSLSDVQLVEMESPAIGLPFADFSASLEALTSQGPAVVFLMDEFEYLAQNPKLDPGFFAGLRSIASNLNVAFVTASVQDLLELTYADNGVLGSPFFNIFSTIALRTFEDGEANSLISGPSHDAGVDFPAQTTGLIETMADHHPYLLQVTCFHTFEMMTRTGTLDTAGEEQLRKAVAKDLENHFRSAWYHLNSGQRRVLASLQSSQLDAANYATLKTLSDRALIRGGENAWVPTGSLWAAFVAEQSMPAPVSESNPAPELPKPELSVNGPTPEECVLSVHLTADRPVQITVDLQEHGDLSYVSEKASIWNVDQAELNRLYDAVYQLYSEGSGHWQIDAKKLGGALYDAVIDGPREVHDAFLLGLSRHEPQNVHIRFLVPRNCLRMPFELLHDGRDWLAFKHPLAKYITGEHTRGPSLPAVLRPGTELRALLVGADISGKVSVDDRTLILADLPDVEFELEEVGSALQRSAEKMGVRLQLDVLHGPDATAAQVRNSLARNTYDLIHYSGHGFHDQEEPDNSALFLWDGPDAENPMAVKVGEIKSLLENCAPRFIFFSCCTGAGKVEATALDHDDFLGIVDAAVQAGVPAVLGMRWPISDHDARKFAREFYAALLPRGEFDSAVLAARQAIGRDEVTWVSPLLVVQA